MRDRFQMMKPLAIRDFALLWTGMSVSMLGNGMTLVAMAWQVYELSNVPTAMSVVGVAWSLPMVVFLLVGGVVSDRFERRRVMIATDLARMAIMATLGVLSLTGHLELWHVVGLAALYGVADSFFSPAFGAIVPEIVPRHMIVPANALESFVRPLAFEMIGPAVGGVAIAMLGEVGEAFLLDAGTFAFSALCLSLVTKRGSVRSAGRDTSAVEDLTEGLRYVRSQTWLWATLLMALFMLLCFLGPWEVLLPYIVKNQLKGGADALGLVFASGGIGAIIASIVLSQRGLPRRHVRFMFLTFGCEVLSISFYGVVDSAWQAMVVAFWGGMCGTSGLIVWQTMMHKLVPPQLQGRVTSVDWLVSIGLVPLSYAVTGPIAAVVGADATMIGAGVIGAAITLGCMAIPGLYDTEKDGSMRDRVEVPEPSSGDLLEELG